MRLFCLQWLLAPLWLAVGLAVAVRAQNLQPTQSRPVFSSESFWYKPLPADAPIHPNSAHFVQEFLRQKRAYYGTVAINTTGYASPVYVVDENTPRVTVRQWDCQHKGYIDEGLAEQWKAVPVPTYALPA